MTQEYPNTLNRRISELALLHASETELPKNMPLDSKWQQLVLNEPAKFLTSDGGIDFDCLANFRRMSIFVNDLGPSSDFASLDPDTWLAGFLKAPVRALADFLKERILGVRRGHRQLLRDVYGLLERDGAIDLLRKYPVKGTPGNPYSFKYRETSYNLRWVRHIYFNNLIHRYLADDIRSLPRFVNADIGCSYGIFSSVFKSEFKNTTQVLVDFPDQLLLAYYYLGNMFPNARIASLADFIGSGKLTREYIERFDFVLVPISHFSLLDEGSIDMLTNFFSFGEMRPEWFRSYIESDAFHGARYFFTCNRFESAPRMEPTYDTDLTILDYPLSDFEKLHFGVFPLYPYYVSSHAVLSYQQNAYSSQYFDFVGRRRI